VIHLRFLVLGLRLLFSLDSPSIQIGHLLLQEFLHAVLVSLLGIILKSVACGCVHHAVVVHSKLGSIGQHRLSPGAHQVVLVGSRLVQAAFILVRWELVDPVGLLLGRALLLEHFRVSSTFLS